ncbi:MAG: sodium:proton antiporter [Clostridiales Family XIII bacterium]|nr:sodium:proton antiporter [Clostridiales Family XIII bacterium]
MILVVAIVVSNLMDSAYPKFPLPLAQIGCGVLIALTPFDAKITINPELFMGLLVAPLLFRESEETDIAALWKVRKTVIFLAFGLVFVTVFVIGYSVHSLGPAIPLAACFCLGAALGPTDAIAVSSVSNRIQIGDRIMNLLKGEFLINDASGVIAFNFAALALVTGSFSMINAGTEFLLLCAGGLGIGMAVASVKSFALRSLRGASIRNAAAFMLIEILTPFLCFFVAEGIGVSGIIAAVTAGSRQMFAVRKLERFEAEFATLKKSVWEMITVVFNSFIFILLGLSLPSIIKAVVYVEDYSIGFAIGVGLFATGVMFAVRFLGVAVGARGLGGKDPKEKLRDWAILTLSGVKGTVSLATAFSLPLALYGGEVFGHRDFLLFVTACAIIVSLVISTIFLPIIAKPKRPRRTGNMYARIIRDVVREVGASGGEYADAIVIYLKRRARQLEYEGLGVEQRREADEIKREFAEREVRLLEKQRKDGEITEAEYEDCRMILHIITVMQDGSPAKQYYNRMRFAFRLIGRAKGVKPGVCGGDDTALSARVRSIFWSNTGRIGALLERKYSGGKDDILARVIEGRVDVAVLVMERYYGKTLRRRLDEDYDREVKRCFGLERRKLDEYLNEGRISEDEADEIRVQINTLEIYAIRDLQSAILTERGIHLGPNKP